MQSIGWQGWVTGKPAGTTGRGLRVEAIQVRLGTSAWAGALECSAHVQNVGWKGYVGAGKTCGSTGQGRRVEALRLRLTGSAAQHLDVWYRVHAQNVGWMDWAKNGASAGTQGLALRLESVQVVVTRKGAAAPGATATPFAGAELSGRAHVQNLGWRGWAGNRAVLGTTGRGLRVEAVQLKLGVAPWTGSLECSAHVQDVGWKGYVGSGSTCGTSGQSRRVEALKLRISGVAAQHFDVWYRVHAQNLGWMGWAKNGAPAGTEGQALRLEAVQVVVTLKGAPAPGSTARAFRSAPAYQTPGGLRKISYGGIAAFGGTGFNLTPGMNGLKVQMVADLLGVHQYHQSMSSLLVSKVASWQRAHGLPGTGVVDHTTWTRMGFSSGSWWSIDAYKAPLRVNPTMSRSQIVEAFVATAMSYNGARYIWGGANAPQQGADCSGLVLQALYSVGIDPSPINTVNHALPAWRSSRELFALSGFRHVPFSARQRGDIVFYRIGSQQINHVAIYLGGDRIIEENGRGRVSSVYLSGLVPEVVRPLP